MKIRTGDTVIVIAGKDKGKSGTVLRVLPNVNRVIVTGINMRTKHVKKTFQQAGQKLTFEASIHISNVMAVDPKTKKPTRIGYKVTEKGKVRVAMKSGEQLTKVRAAKPAKATEDKQKQKVKAEKQEQDSLKPEDKQPFWKKMKFGSAAIDAAEVDEGSRMEQDQSIPDEQRHVRSGSRGS
jgi:large subunit ribosomal protein L24